MALDKNHRVKLLRGFGVSITTKELDIRNIVLTIKMI